MCLLAFFASTEIVPTMKNEAIIHSAKISCSYSIAMHPNIRPLTVIKYGVADAETIAPSLS